MNSNEINALLTAQGIDPLNLSPEVKEGLNEILRSAGRTALESFIKIMEAEARKRGISVSTPQSPTAQNEAAKQAAAALKAQQEAEAAAAAKRRRNIIIGISTGVVGLIGIVIIIVRKRNK